MNVAVVANTGKEGTKNLLPEFVSLLEKEDVGVILHDELRDIIGDGYDYRSPETLTDDADFIVSFGGDGTILYTARITEGKSVPILGVNLGKVGFLAEISPDEIHTIPSRLKNGDYEVIKRSSFTVSTSCGKEYFALNDIVLDRNIDTRILTLTAKVDDQYAGEFHADGLIIATPTGSTAHSMAAGGPLVMPECDVIILSPICPHSLTIRPMIIDGSKELRIGVSEGLARMAVDGQSFVNVPAGSEVVIRSSGRPVRVARFRDKTYFDILHTRLKWGVSLKMRNA